MTLFVFSVGSVLLGEGLLKNPAYHNRPARKASDNAKKNPIFFLLLFGASSGTSGYNPCTSKPASTCCIRLTCLLKAASASILLSALDGFHKSVRVCME